MCERLAENSDYYDPANILDAEGLKILIEREVKARIEENERARDKAILESISASIAQTDNRDTITYILISAKNNLKRDLNSLNLDLPADKQQLVSEIIEEILQKDTS